MISIEKPTQPAQRLPLFSRSGQMKRVAIINDTPKKKKKVKTEGNEEEESPFKDYARPSAMEVKNCVYLLEALHGKPERSCSTTTVLDTLVRTILSQNTTDKNSRAAFLNLKKHFPSYASVLAAAPGAVEDSIRSGGLADKKAENIKAILRDLLIQWPQHCINGEPSLEFMRDLPTSQVKDILLAYKGVGPKTISCVLMFNMAREEFPVDTHVFHIAKKLQWAPSSCGSPELCYAHLNARVPAEDKYSLHVLLVEHGKRCPSCSKGGRTQLPPVGPCPLSNWTEKRDMHVSSLASIAAMSACSSPSSSSASVSLGCDLSSAYSYSHVEVKEEVKGKGSAKGKDRKPKVLHHHDLQCGVAAYQNESKEDD